MAIQLDSSRRVDVAKIFVIPRVLLTPLGLWFDEKRVRGGGDGGTRKSRLFFSCLVTVLIIVLPLIYLSLVIVNIAVGKHLMADLIFLICIVIRILSALNKIYLLKTTKTKFKELCDEHLEFDAVPREIRREHAVFRERCSKMPKSLIFLAATILTIYIPFWIFSNETKAPIPIWLPAGLKEKHPILYSAIFISLSLSLLCIACIYVGFNAFLISLSTTCNAMLLYMTDALTALSHPSRFSRKRNNYNKRVKKNLIHVHKLHLKVLGFAECVNKHLSTGTLVEVWSILATQCACAFLLSAKGSSMKLPRVLALLQIITIVTVLFGFVCYEASKIITQSKIVNKSFLTTAWWTWNKENVVFVKIMSIRSEEPISFKIGKLRTISLRSFVILLNISFSYFMVLKQLKQVKKT